ncbi:hypothetical protein BD413DRAFT_615418 [Trametes elegans]|nr:hypothetical protein BD413DRAFT_615418 [Trametes elegans]
MPSTPRRMCKTLRTPDGPRCLAPLPPSARICCDTHSPDFDASYAEYKTAARAADAQRVYAQLERSAVPWIDVAIIDFYLDGIRNYVDAVNIELRLFKEHEVQFFVNG